MFVWARENGSGQGSLDQDISKDVERLKKTISTSFIKEEVETAKEDLAYYYDALEFLEDDKELFEISRIFLQTDWKYSGGIVVGKEFESTKSYLKWNGFKPKDWLPVMHSMANEWIKHIPKKKK